HAIGPIIGVHRNTGAGGANVWSYQLLQRLATLDEDVLPEYSPLPGGADFHVAIRRTVRVGLNAGDVLEDLGVVPNELHQMTKTDLLEDNQDLLNTAARTLVNWQAKRPLVQVQDQSGDVTVTVPEGSSADFTLNIRAEPFQGAQSGTQTFNLTNLLARRDALALTLAINVQDADGESFNHYINLNPISQEENS
ncbi:MAG: hypothetical protein WAM60_06790, partial [Candidatus Promineifilaceae bacterium]